MNTSYQVATHHNYLTSIILRHHMEVEYTSLAVFLHRNMMQHSILDVLWPSDRGWWLWYERWWGLRRRDLEDEIISSILPSCQWLRWRQWYSIEEAAINQPLQVKQPSTYGRQQQQQHHWHRQWKRHEGNCVINPYEEEDDNDDNSGSKVVNAVKKYYYYYHPQGGGHDP
jgi:hypothetical protein